MSKAVLPPRGEELIDENNIVTLPWQIFLEALAVGDSGNAWTPTFVGLTETGVATKSGLYYYITNKLVFFRITITPATDTSGTAGITYCDNFPLLMAANGFSATSVSFTAALAGVTASDKRIYTGTWSALTVPITILGLVEVR